MPRVDFRNIAQEKKTRIFDAAKKEFINVPFDEVSINRICEDAEISRGSFYLYFENKLDLYYYIFLEQKRMIYERMLEDINKHLGIFDMAEDIFNFIMSFCNKEEQIFYKRLIYNLNDKILPYFVEQRKIYKNKRPVADVTLIGDYHLLNINTEDDFADLTEVIYAITTRAIYDVFTGKSSLIDTRKELKRKLNLLKRACYK